MPKRTGCPVQATVRLLAGKWKVQILWHLSFAPMRFHELKRRLAKVSEKVLTEQLRQLEQDGVIVRSVLATVPPQVTYSLNAHGEALIPMLSSLCDWGSSHFDMEPTLPRHIPGLETPVPASAPASREP